VSKIFSVRDFTEEFAACSCIPVKEGWAIPSWVPEERRAFGLFTPDFGEAFSYEKNVSIERNFPLFCLLRIAVIDAKEVEVRAVKILGPISGNEYELLLWKLGGTRKNLAFYFLGIEAPLSGRPKACSLCRGQGDDPVAAAPPSFWRSGRCGGAVLVPVERNAQSC